MKNMIYPWQENSWRQLQQLGERLPHAILFHGSQGIGKTAFVEQFAQALLCEQAQSQQGYACGSCPSCTWFAQYSHPDYRRVRPEAMETKEAQSDDQMELAEGEKSGKKGKAPSKEIKIDQIRALADFMNVSTHRQGMRVIMLYPAEALNHAAANALLKTLEEPPPRTVFLLISNHIDRLLPTILSRCHKCVMTTPPYAEALSWLQAQGVQDADRWLAEQGGAPLAAHAWAQTGNQDEIDAFLQVLAQPEMEAILKMAEKLQKTSAMQSVKSSESSSSSSSSSESSASMALIEWIKCLQRWLYDMISYALVGKIRYYPRYQSKLARLAGLVEVTDLLRGLKALNERCAIVHHPLSAKLFMEDLLLDYFAIFCTNPRSSI